MTDNKKKTIKMNEINSKLKAKLGEKDKEINILKENLRKKEEDL